MAERGGSQCGYCTPGFVVSMFAEQFRRHGTIFAPDTLGGNLCRCTGYRPIRDAMQSLGAPPDTALRRRLESPAPPVLPMHYESPGGRFSRPGSLAECLKLAATTDGSAQFVAGNTDLGVMTNLRHRRFPHLIALDGIPELREFRDGPDMVEIGAGLTLTEIAEHWTAAPDLFRDWLRLFASPLIRNRATLGGNLATASPIGDAAPLLLALDAELNIAGLGGQRTIPLHSFFSAYRQTSLERGEVIRSVRIPKPLPTHARFYKVAKRRVDDISTVAAGIVIRTDGSARIAFGGVAPIPLRAVEAEEAMVRGDLQRAKDILRRTLHPIERSSRFCRVQARHGPESSRQISVVRCPQPQASARGNSMKIAGQPLPHESARGHVTGEALYTDDLVLRFPEILHAWPVLSPHAHAFVVRLNADLAMEEPGVIATLTAADVPGEGDSGSNRHDEPLFPAEVTYHSQPVAWVLGETLEAARLGASKVNVEYRVLTPVLTIEDAIAAGSFHSGPHRIRAGERG